MGDIDLQFWSIRDATAEDLLGTIERVAEVGYIVAHVQLELLESGLEETFEFHKTIGSDLIIVPYLDESRRTSKEDYEKIAAILSDIGQKVHEQGFTLAYHNHNHNHDFEFDVFDGQTGFEIIFENTNPDHLKIELDCFWAAYAGHDPLEIIEENTGRIVSLHIKDRQDKANEPTSTELGTGTLPLSNYVQKGKENQVKWFVVEQGHFTRDPLESAADNAQTLKDIVGK